MSEDHLLRETKTLEIQAYRKPEDFKAFLNTHVSFSGSPRKHPYDPAKVVLVADPYSTNTFYFEFRSEDISYVEELPNLVSAEGEAVTMVRIWVKKTSIGLRCTPFVVEDTMPRERD
jgi:inorganic pyrophosphatase